MIVTLQLRPGQRISEIEVASALRASKTPVREALIRLEEVGLVKIIPQSGTYVTPIRIKGYVEACFMRLQLERGAVRNAAGRPQSSRSAAKLHSNLSEQREAFATENYGALFDLDEALHQMFFECGGLAGVWDAVKRLQSDVYRVRHLKSLHKIRRGPEMLEEHAAIVDAILSGNPDAAEQALIHHIGALDREVSGASLGAALLEHIEALNGIQTRTPA